MFDVTRGHDVRRLKVAPRFEVDGEADELAHRPSERCGRACAFAKPERAAWHIPDLFGQHQAIVREAEHVSEPRARCITLTKRDFIFAALAREQGPEPTFARVMPVEVPRATVVHLARWLDAART